MITLSQLLPEELKQENTERLLLTEDLLADIVKHPNVYSQKTIIVPLSFVDKRRWSSKLNRTTWLLLSVSMKHNISYIISANDLTQIDKRLREMVFKEWVELKY